MEGWRTKQIRLIDQRWRNSRLLRSRSDQTIEAVCRRGWIDCHFDAIGAARSESGEILPIWIGQRRRKLDRVGMVGHALEFHAESAVTAHHRRYLKIAERVGRIRAGEILLPI